jgi:short-subunit dehydrogenase
MEFALITGASKGIGKGIAEELASRKVPVLLVARSEALLAELAASLTAKHGVAAHYFAIDLADPAAPAQVHAWTQQNSYRVNILVNNAGYGLSGPFDQYSPKSIAI